MSHGHYTSSDVAIFECYEAKSTVGFRDVDIAEVSVLAEVFLQLLLGHLRFEREAPDKDLTWKVGGTLGGVGERDS